MQPHEERVVTEKKELDEKVSKLEPFISSNQIFPKLPIEDQELLKRQLVVMKEYSSILYQRINRFGKENN